MRSIEDFYHTCPKCGARGNTFEGYEDQMFDIIDQEKSTSNWDEWDVIDTLKCKKCGSTHTCEH